MPGVKSASGDPHQLISTACYYQFDPGKLNAAWTQPQELPKNYPETCVPAAKFRAPTA